MTYYAVKIPKKFPEKPIEVNEFERDKKVMSYADFNCLKALCGPSYDMWETVTVRMESVPFIMLVEEEGKFKGYEVNALASALYGNPYDVIVGDVWLCVFDGKEDLEFLDEVGVGMIKAHLLKRYGITPQQFIVKAQD